MLVPRGSAMPLMLSSTLLLPLLWSPTTTIAGSSMFSPARYGRTRSTQSRRGLTSVAQRCWKEIRPSSAAGAAGAPSAAATAARTPPPLAALYAISTFGRGGCAPARQRQLQAAAAAAAAARRLGGRALEGCSVRALPAKKGFLLPALYDWCMLVPHARGAAHDVAAVEAVEAVMRVNPACVDLQRCC